VLALSLSVGCGGGVGAGGAAGNGGAAAGEAGGRAGREGGSDAGAAGSAGSFAGGAGGAAGAAGSGVAGAPDAGTAGIGDAGRSDAGAAGSAMGGTGGAGGTAGAAGGGAPGGAGGGAGATLVCPSGGAGGAAPPPVVLAPSAWSSDANCTGIHWIGWFAPGHGDDCVIEVTGSTPDVHGLEYHDGVIPITGGPQWPFPPVETPDVLPAVHGTIGYPQGLPVSSFYDSTRSFDLTGDGFNDLVVSYVRPSAGLVYMLLQSQNGGNSNGGGFLGFMAPSLSSDVGFTPAPRGLLFTEGALSDFNNDGKNDMFFAAMPGAPGRLYWYTMSYAGGELVTFNETDSGMTVDPCATVERLRDSYLKDPSNGPYQPIPPVLDFNLDGNADQVVVVNSAVSGPRIFIAAGAGDGTFSHTIEVPIAGLSQSPLVTNEVEPGDGNNDGIPDLGLVFENPGDIPTYVTLYGDGAFGFSTTLP
jgi:hypothetical protein